MSKLKNIDIATWATEDCFDSQGVRVRWRVDGIDYRAGIKVEDKDNLADWGRALSTLGATLMHQAGAETKK